jgi:hypothetical protein
MLVVYHDRTVLVSNPTEFPDVTDTSNRVKRVEEPIVKATIIVPEGKSTSFRPNHPGLTSSSSPLISSVPGRDAGPLLRQSRRRGRIQIPRRLGELLSAHHDVYHAPERDRHGLFRQTQEP